MLLAYLATLYIDPSRYRGAGPAGNAKADPGPGVEEDVGPMADIPARFERILKDDAAGGGTGVTNNDLKEAFDATDFLLLSDIIVSLMHTDRVKIVQVEGGQDHAYQWIGEERADVSKDTEARLARAARWQEVVAAELDEISSGHLPSTPAEKAAVLHAIAYLDGKPTQKKVRRAAEAILGDPAGSLDAKQAAVMDVCREEGMLAVPPARDEGGYLSPTLRRAMHSLGGNNVRILPQCEDGTFLSGVYERGSDNYATAMQYAIEDDDAVVVKCMTSWSARSRSRSGRTVGTTRP